MNELIHITTDEQGSEVVSARELHEFLEVETKFASWISRRIKKYGLVENQDYTTYSQNWEKGRPEIEYALTLDAAKELAMVEGNERGKQARQYFIDAEKALRKAIEAPTSAPSTTEQVLLQLVSQTNQIMATQSELLAQLRSDVDQIMQGHKKPSRSGKQLNLPGTHPPSRRGGISSGQGLRQLIHGRVVEYCSYHEATTQETYHYLYKRMLDVYRVDVYRLARAGADSILDAVERYGHLDRLYSLVMAELIYSEDQP